MVHGLVGVQGAAPAFPDRTELGAGYAFESYPERGDTLHGFYLVAGYRIVDALPHRVVASLRAEMLGRDRPEPGGAVRFSYGNTAFVERERSKDSCNGATGIHGDLGWAVYADVRGAGQRFDGSVWTITAGLSIKLPVAYLLCWMPR